MNGLADVVKINLNFEVRVPFCLTVEVFIYDNNCGFSPDTPQWYLEVNPSFSLFNM